MDKCVASFSLGLSLNGEDGDELPNAMPGDEVQVLYGLDLLLTGSVDSIEERADKESHSYTITGRSKTKDLVDCSATVTAQFKGQTLKSIASKLAEQYGVQVIVNAPDKVVGDFQVEHGETVFNALERLAENSKLYITDTADGHLVISQLNGDKSRNSIIRTAEENSGVIEVSRIRTEEGRYSRVIVRSQKNSSDDDFGRSAAQINAESVDRNYRRNKTKIILADSAMTIEDATARAEWEIQAAIGKSDVITYTVQGWRGNAGIIWRENMRLDVKDDFLGIDGEYAISAIDYDITDDGTNCTLVLMLPDAFLPEPVAKKPLQKPKKAQVKKPKKAKEEMHIWHAGDPV
jgi:prophage tail gpP-like protein